VGSLFNDLINLKKLNLTNNKMRKYIYVLILTFFLINCKNSNDDKFVDSFNRTETIKLSAQSVDLDKSEMFFSHMFEMKYYEGLIIISDPSELYNMKIVNIKDKKIKNFLKRGHGPNEIPSQASWFSIDNKNHFLYITDGFNYYKYSINNLKTEKYTPDLIFKPVFKNYGFIGATAFSNGFLVGGLYDKKFGVYNVETKVLISKNEYLKAESPLLSQSKFYSHPSKNLICSFQSKSAVMAILKIEKDDIKIKDFSWWTSKGQEIDDQNKISFIAEKGNKNGFITADVTNKYIYSLYSGKVIDDSSLNGLTNSFLSKYVYVFDWEGKPLKRYELDQEVRSITVDEKNNILYAASYFGGEPNLIKYNLR
jgi:hypothetical protein